MHSSFIRLCVSICTKAIPLLLAVPVGAADLCDLVPKSTIPGEPGREGDRARGALVAQARNILFDALKRRGGVWGSASEIGNAAADAGLDPMVAYLGCKGCPKGRANSAIEEFFKGSLKVAFPAVDAVATGGEVVVAGVAYSVDDLYQQTNPGYDIRIANAISFWSVEPMFGRKIDERNIGEKVPSEAELRDLWFKVYGGKIADFLPGGKQEATTMLTQRWPQLLKTWQRSRVSYVIRQFHNDLLAGLTAAKGDSPAGGDVNGVFGLWQASGGSIVAVTQEGGSILARYCRVGKDSAALGIKPGDRAWWGGQVSEGRLGEGPVVIDAHSLAYPQAGDCPSLTPRDMGPQGAKLAFEPSGGTLKATERRIKYYSDKCLWTSIADSPAISTYNRVGP